MIITVNAKSRQEPQRGAKTDRRSRQGRESRQKILDATFELAHELGYQGTSIAKVVSRSGLPASSVYWHFADKDALFAAVIQHSFEQWSALVPTWDPPAEGESWQDAMVDRIHRAIETVATSPEFWRLGLMLSLERQPVEPQARARFQEIRRQVQASMADWWAGVLPSGHQSRSPGLPRLLARFTMAAADGIFIAAQVDDDFGGDTERLALARLLADSLAAAAIRSL